MSEARTKSLMTEAGLNRFTTKDFLNVYKVSPFPPFCFVYIVIINKFGGIGEDSEGPGGAQDVERLSGERRPPSRPRLHLRFDHRRIISLFYVILCYHSYNFDEIGIQRGREPPQVAQGQGPRGLFDRQAPLRSLPRQHRLRSLRRQCRRSSRHYSYSLLSILAFPFLVDPYAIVS